MVGRRLLQCSDLSTWVVGHRVGFEDACYGIVNALKGAWDSVKDTAVNAVNAAKDLAVNTANGLKEAAESALNEVTGWITELGKDIQCVRAPSNPRGSPR